MTVAIKNCGKHDVEVCKTSMERQRKSCSREDLGKDKEKSQVENVDEGNVFLCRASEKTELQSARNKSIRVFTQEREASEKYKKPSSPGHNHEEDQRDKGGGTLRKKLRQKILQLMNARKRKLRLQLRKAVKVVLKFLTPHGSRTRHRNHDDKNSDKKVEETRFFCGDEETDTKLSNPPVTSNHSHENGICDEDNGGATGGCKNWQLYDAEFCAINDNTVNNRGSLLEVDGAISDEISDPPGQQSVHITSGDIRHEAYRLSTFEHFPASCPINRRSLAKSGFYYTGFSDRVKCFACGRSVEKWEVRDDPKELRWHKSNCPLLNGVPCENVPINDPFNRLNASSQTEVIHQTDLNTGEVIRTVRYPVDLPERIRRTGGIFEIGPGNEITIQSGPVRPAATRSQSNSNPPEQRPFRLANVVSPDHRRFLSNLYLNRELDRLSSFGRWPVSRPIIPPTALARSGFFYLGDMDRTQCFSCSGVLRNWTIEDDAFDEHRNHFPNCKMVLGTENRNVPIPEDDASPDIRKQQFPCLYPSNPHMRNEAVRLATFDQRWPRGVVGASPAVIAQAGFFFLGERDRVKCWYCNGGLQNWEYEDLPWIEHAKWFPNCQFVLQNQGVRFVYRNLSLYPHLSRPIIARQEGANIDPAGTNTPRAGLATRGGEDIVPSVRQPSPLPVIIDPQVEMKKKKEKISNIIRDSEIVKTVTGMGFSEESVRYVIEEKIDSGNIANQDDIFESATSLLDAVMEYENNKEEDDEEDQDPPAGASGLFSMSSFHTTGYTNGVSSFFGSAPGSGLVPASSFGEDDDEMERDIYGSIEVPAAQPCNSASNSLRETLDKMEEERQCKVCFSNIADMVFIPCGHMICCMDCTQALRQCPVCRKKIEKAIKTYIQ